MKNLFTLLFLLLTSGLGLQAQCSITDVTFTDLECDAYEEYYAEIDFDYENVGDQGFMIWYTYGINTNDVYQYEDLPVTIGPIPGFCNSGMDVEIVDVENANTCSENIVEDLQCCGNEATVISNLEVTSECNDDGTFVVEVSFDDEESSSLGYEIDVRPLPLMASPNYTFGPFDFMGSNTQTLSIPEITNCADGYRVVVRDVLEVIQGGEAFTDIDICCPLPCSISEFNLEPYADENCNGEIYEVEFSFEGENFGLDGFTVTDGTSTLNYNLGDNYVFVIFPDCENSVDLTITDNNDPNCSLTTTFASVCCPCVLDPEYSVEASECYQNTSFDLTHTIAIVSGACVNGEWTATIEGVEYPVVYTGPGFTYITESVVAEDSLVIVEICDDFSNNCFSQEIVNPCFNSSNTDCVFLSFDVVLQNNICDEDSSANYIFQYEVENEGSEGYSVYADGELLFSQDYPLEAEWLVSSNCGVNTVFTIEDNEFPDCSLTAEEEICCEVACEITSFSVTLDSANCTGEIAFMEFEFEASASFGLEGFYVNDQFYNIGDVYQLAVSSDCNEEYSFTITDALDPNCSAEYVFGTVCCPCELEYSAEAGNCESNSTTVIHNVDIESGSCLWFDFEATINDELFDVAIEGNNYVTNDVSFPNDSLLIIEFCTLASTEECWTDTIVNPCYDPDSEPICMFLSFDVVVQNNICDEDSSANYIFQYEVENEGSEGYSVYADGELLFSQDYPLEAEWLVSSNCGVNTVFTIEDNEFPDCYLTVEEEICCEEPCSLTEFTLEPYNDESCFGELYGIEFSFVGENFGLDGFTVTDGTITQSYNLGDAYVYEIFPDCESSYELTITDNNDPNCSLTTTFGSVCCPCVLDPEYSVEASDCYQDSLFDLTHNIAIVSGACVNGEWTATVEGVEYPVIYTGPGFTYITESLTAEDSLVVVEICNESGGDCFSQTIVNPCYDSTADDCAFLSFTPAVVSSVCEGDSALVIFNYEVVNEGTSGYSVYANDELLFTESYPNVLELYIASDCDADYAFEIIDNDDNACSAAEDLEVCCPQGIACTVSEVEILDFEVNFENLFVDFVLEVDAVGECEVEFDVYLNGDLLGQYEMDGSSISLEQIFVENNEEDLVFNVCPTNELENCSEVVMHNPHITVSADDVLSQIQVYVSNDKLVVENTTDKTVSLSLYDNMGRQVLGNIIIQPSDKMAQSINNLTPGIYIAVLENRISLRTNKVFIGR